MMRLALVASLVTFAPHHAAAHFILQSPESWRVQDGLGYPQKTGPCGEEGSSPATGVVTAFSPGETVTITIGEVIYHPGHYRVALAVNDRSELPPEPPVTPGDTACGSAAITTPAVFPVLADGVLGHAAPFDGPQSFQVTLPSDVTCERCTLQVLEFMSDHAAPCFYYHCADISIGTGGGGCTVDANCDDGDACTLDTCDAGTGCSSRALTLADVNAGFLGVLDAPSCEGEDVPSAVGRPFDRASSLLAQAAENQARARRYLKRAAKKLRKAAKKTAKAQGRGMSTECGSALGAILDEAEVRVGCLMQ